MNFIYYFFAHHQGDKLPVTDIVQKSEGRGDVTILNCVIIYWFKRGRKYQKRYGQGSEQSGADCNLSGPDAEVLSRALFLSTRPSGATFQVSQGPVQVLIGDGRQLGVGKRWRCRW
jgi:hypothetical protein